MKIAMKSYGKTDVGKKRSVNEDTYLELNKDALFIVADGMGGHAAGEIASKMAVNIVKDFILQSESEADITWPFGFDPKFPAEVNRMRNAIRLANREIFAKANSDLSVAGMGTTIVVLLIRDGYAYVAHVGDSRIYLVRNSSIYRLTNDHSWVEDQIKVGNLTEQEARSHPMRNVITRALGIHEDVEVDLRMERCNDNDFFLLCTDGLTTHVEDHEIIEAVSRSKMMVEKTANFLVEEANRKGGEDNITVIAVNLCQDTHM